MTKENRIKALTQIEEDDNEKRYLSKQIMYDRDIELYRFIKIYAGVGAGKNVFVDNLIKGEEIKNTDGTIIIPEEDSYLHGLGLVIKAGATLDNVIFKPQLELGESATEFEMYKGEEKFVTEADESLELKSASPGMTLIPDKEGVSIGLEYNKDTNKVIESLINAIISLGGNI